MTSRSHNARLGRTGAALVAAILAVSPAPALAQAPKAAAPAAAPKLVLAEEKKDVGTVPKGEVIQQSPGAGQEADEGDTVTIVVSNYEEPSEDPSESPSETTTNSPGPPTDSPTIGSTP